VSARPAYDLASMLPEGGSGPDGRRIGRSMRLVGKVALVTGGSSGIGRAVCVALSAEGASVVVAGRDEQRARAVTQAILEGGGRALTVRCDVRSENDCERAVERTIEEFGRLDVLFNNAGIIYRAKTTTETSPEEWDETFAVNARGTYLMSRFALPYLAETRGVIVNNASYLGLVGGRGVAAYAASKGAVVLLTKAMALDHANEGVRVNCVCPGSVETPMLVGEMAALGGGDEVRPAFEAKHPLGRIATPDEIARAVVFLASDEASFVTGAALPIDGGITAG